MAERAEADVVVVGAGVAGLATARALREAGVRVIVLEGRDRIGGRVLTHRDPRVPVPIELGAEFVHGTATETLEIVRRSGLRMVEVAGERWGADSGRLVRIDDFWQRVNRVMERLDPERAPDRSLHDFFRTRPGGRALAADRALTRQFVEGFHAADVALVSERALARGGNPGEDEGEQRQGRVLDGYDRVPASLADGLEDAIRLGTMVTRVEWARGSVRAHARSDDGRRESVVDARAAIVTVPLGVLQARPPARGAIEFSPEPRPLAAIGGLAMGSVVRVTLWLSELPWEHGGVRGAPKGARFGQLAFLQTRDPHLPVWWTAFPVRVPLLVGWSGGPSAKALAAEGRASVEKRAVESLAGQLGMTRRRIERLIEGCWTHDWEHDLFSRGAYSYALVGGSDAARALARPADGTLYFAGEATASEGATGTVAGAIGAGRRAAKQAIRGLSLSRRSATRRRSG